MSLLKKTTEAAKSQTITSCDIITKDEFLKLFVSLRPHYDLDDEAILELFQMTDERKERAIKADQVQKILDTILSIEEPNVAEQEPDSESDCVSIYLKQSGKLSLSQKRVDLKTNLEQNPTIMPSEQRASFDLNKIREVKSIFEMCESGKGHVSFEHIKNFIKEYSSGSCTIDELVETFYQMKQEDQDIITKETFLLRMNKIERTVLNFCSKEEDEEQKSLDKESFEPICHFENGREVFVEGLEQEIKLILEKVDIVMNQTEKRVNEIDIIAVLKEIPSMFSHLEKKIKQNENLFKEQRDMMSEHLKRENKLLERIGDLEMNLDSAKGFFEDMQYQNDALCEINQELELKIQVQEHIKNDLKNKNIEIVELEIKVRRMARQSEELRNQVSQIQEEKEVISKELQMLLEQLNKDDNTETIATRASTQSNYAIEIEMLKLELSNVTKNFKKEKEYLNNLISELETQLKSIKNFVEEVRLEKVKLQEELKAVQERNLGESVVTQKERRDTSNILRMYLGEDYEEKLKSRRVSKQVSNLGESLPNLKRSVYSYNYENKEIIGNEQAEEKLVDPPENAGLSAIKENGEEEDRQAKGKVLHHASTAPLEISGVIYYPRSGHNLRNLSKDYLSIRNHHQIIKILKDYKEAADRVMCFSDYIYTINSKEQREHRILFISGEALYCLHPKRNYEVQKRIPLNSIHQITVITSSAGLCMIHAKDSPEYYAIDSYKRLHLIQYLQEIFKVRGMESFSMAYQEKLLEAPSPHILAKKTEIYKTFMNPELQPVYKNAAKCGELYMKSGMIFNSVKKYFFVLTNLGLICFKNSGDKRPIDFIPVIDYSLIDLPNNMIDKKYWFEIKFPFSSFEVELAAGSELEKREWISAIKKTQKQQIDI